MSSILRHQDEKPLSGTRTLSIRFKLRFAIGTYLIAMVNLGEDMSQLTLSNKLTVDTDTRRDSGSTSTPERTCAGKVTAITTPDTETHNNRYDRFRKGGYRAEPKTGNRSRADRVQWSQRRKGERRPRTEPNPNSEWSREALKPWAKYPKLFGERKFCKVPTNARTSKHCHSSAQSPQAQNNPNSTGFFDLPLELRDQIYRELLVLDEAIELWPIGEHVLKTDPDDNDSMYIKYIKPGAVYATHHRELRRRLWPKVLRVCKTVNVEASRIFYGNNEFRFSGGLGWTMLNSFLRTIGPSSCRMMRHLSVIAPGLDAQHESKSAARRLESILSGKHVLPQVFFDYAREVTSAVQLIRDEMPDLRKLDLLIYIESDLRLGSCSTIGMKDRAEYVAMRDLANLVDDRFELAALLFDSIKWQGFYDEERADLVRFYRSIGLPFYSASWRYLGRYDVLRDVTLTAEYLDAELEKEEEDVDWLP